MECDWMWACASDAIRAKERERDERLHRIESFWIVWLASRACVGRLLISTYFVHRQYFRPLSVSRTHSFAHSLTIRRTCAIFSRPTFSMRAENNQKLWWIRFVCLHCSSKMPKMYLKWKRILKTTIFSNTKSTQAKNQARVHSMNLTVRMNRFTKLSWTFSVIKMSTSVSKMYLHTCLIMYT